MSDFDDLANDLETLAKSQSSDADVAAAAEEAGVDAGDYDHSDDDKKATEGGEGSSGDDDVDADAGEEEGEEDDDEEEDGEEFGKSTSMMDENGEEVTAIDATELLKSMSMRIESLEQENGADESLVKSMNLIVDMLKAQDGRLKAQDGLINTMSKRLDKISKSGTGRRTIVTTQENLTKSESVDSDLNGAGVDIMAKAENAMSEGKIFARHVAEIEGCLNSGREIPAHIMANLK